jgi:hypothetical protein
MSTPHLLCDLAYVFACGVAVSRRHRSSARSLTPEVKEVEELGRGPPACGGLLVSAEGGGNWLAREDAILLSVRKRYFRVSRGAGQVTSAVFSASLVAPLLFLSRCFCH